MPGPPTPPEGYTVTHHYCLPEDAWHLELDHQGARGLLTAVIPDEDPKRQPSFRFSDPGGSHEVLYEVMRWFMAYVADHVGRIRAWMSLPPDTVDTIVSLREVRYTDWGEGDHEAALVLLAESLPHEQAAAVVAELLSDADRATVLSDLACPPEVAADRVEALRARMAEAGWRSGTTYE
ncbi:hypothetical protein [Streptomyces sp. CC77]|uniref:hypothetical protein n=1 Tax=Streptomyces sp. CC77 TaxID=1906739 RepID=UPI0008DD6123|nr:hypothetical protein [Streptomyces sp. CC77]OII67124.1 hypothetical protein BJP39_07240 [Streptomyces sp. CC77]